MVIIHTCPFTFIAFPPSYCGMRSPVKAALIASLKERAAALQKELHALYLAARDPRVPWFSKALLGLVLAYAFSPIDLIPDFIPVLGYLDDLILIPLGIALAIKTIPPQVMADARKQAELAAAQGQPISRVGAVLIIAIWLVVIAAVVLVIVHIFSK